MDDRPTRPIRMPGVGTRMDLVDEDGRTFAVVGRNDGGCDLYLPAGVEPPVRLGPSATRAMAALVSGNLAVAPGLIERFEGVLGGLTFDWLRLPRGSDLIDRSIAESRVRQRTGITIVAVLRGQRAITSPDAGEVLRAGDDLVVVGRESDVEHFRFSLSTEVMGPGDGP